MASFSRALRTWDPLRVAAGALGGLIVILVAAYGFGISTSDASLVGIIAAAALAAIGGTGLLYAWRLGAGGLVE
jgi:hypothetical protein